jgi:hypothetical protein
MRRILLALVLPSSSALANSSRNCGYEPDLGEGWVDYPNEEVYIVTEFNDPRKIPFSALIQYTLKKYEECGNGCHPISEFNAYWMGSDVLWQEVETTQGERVRLACGGEVKCLEPLLAENVRCYVEKADCDSTWDPYVYPEVLETYYLDCRGDRSCISEDQLIEDCCIITSVVGSDGITKTIPNLERPRSRARGRFGGLTR